MQSRPPFGVRLLRACLVLSVLSALLCGVGVFAAVRFGPDLLLRGLNFEPAGSVDAVFARPTPPPAAAASAAPPLVALLLAMPAEPSMLPTQTPRHTDTPMLPTHTPALPTQTPRPTDTLLPDAPTQTPTLTDTAAPSPTQTPTQTPTPTAGFQRVDTPAQLTVYAPGYVDVTVPTGDTYAESVVFAQRADGAVAAAFAFRETALESLCAVVLNGCRAAAFRVESVDFRQNGFVVYGSVNVGTAWQALGVAVALDDPAVLRMRIAGVVYDGVVYRLPSSGQIADALAGLLARANAALADLTLRAGGYALPLRQLVFEDDRLTLLWGEAGG